MVAWVRLGDACRQARQLIDPHSKDAALPYLSLEHIEAGTGKVLKRPSGMVEDEGRSTTFAFDKRHVLYGKLRPYLNKVALPDFEGRCTTELIPLLPENGVDREYLGWVLRREETVAAAMQGKTGSRMPRADLEGLFELSIPLPPLPEQQRIAAWLKAQLAEVETAQVSAAAQQATTNLLEETLIRESLEAGSTTTFPLAEVTIEIKRGVGAGWASYPVLGATREGLALAKEPVGKSPERYKPVTPGTVFYNPMRINIGSIALVDEGDTPGITSPDYVALTGIEGKLHYRWFYHWLRSSYGMAFIKFLARGAVRERMLYNRLVDGEIALPDWDAQVTTANRLAALRPLKARIAEQLETLHAIPKRLLAETFSNL